MTSESPRRISRPSLLALSAGLMVASLTSCAAVRGQVTARDVRAPVSLTPHVYDCEGRILTLGEELEEVGRFSTEERFLGAFYGFAPPWWTWDASEYLTEQLRRYDGEAIVDLQVEVEESNGGETLLAFFTQTSPMIPIWVKVRLKGVVVRR